MVEEKKKKFAFKFEDSKMILEVDSDYDGKPVLRLELDVTEVFDEIAEAIKNRKK